MANGTVYRRGSILGPLLLIAIGALFLYANLRPEFSPWPLLARYWPVLIILWGLSKLLNYLMLRGRPEAAAATRLTGGDVVGLIFLILIGWGFSQIVQHGWWRGGAIVIDDQELGCLLGNTYEFSDELEQSLTPPTTLTLNNLRGTLTLTTGADDQIRLVARKTVCATSDTEAQRLAAAFEPVLESRAGGTEFHWETPSGSTGFLRADVDIQVPQAVNLKLSNRKGDLRVSGLQGNVSMTVRDGDAVAESIGGDVSVAIRGGSVRVVDVRGSVRVDGRGREIQIRNTAGASVEGRFGGPIHFAAIAGPARFVSRRTTFSAARIDGEMTMDRDEFTLRRVPGEVTLLTKDYEIEVEEIGGPLRIENRNGPVLVRAPTPPTQPIEVETRRGSIELLLPASSGFQIDATARRGEIESDFTAPGLILHREDDRSQVLNGTYGKSRTSIRLSTTYGTIYLRRRGSPTPTTSF